MILDLDEKMQNLEARLDAALCAVRVVLQKQTKLDERMQKIETSQAVIEAEISKRLTADENMRSQFRAVTAQVDTLSDKCTVSRQSLREEICVVRTMVEELRGLWMIKE